MWYHEHSAETGLAPAAIWRVLRDVDHWTDWDTSMRSVSLLGPFGVGTRVSMTPKGQDAIIATIVDARENERYADETQIDGLTLRFSHALTPLPGGGTRITHRLEIHGAEADRLGPRVGPAITEDFPEAMAALIGQAART